MHIVYQDEHFFVLNKPAGYFVHPPAASKYKVADDRICLSILRHSLKRAIYPVHRLDAPTSGLIIFAYSKDSTRKLSELFHDREIKKTYRAVVRGHMLDESTIAIPLESTKAPDGFFNAETCVFTRAKIELPFAVGKKYPTARYSLIDAKPATGRWHQIRRHLDRVAHPILGDIEHGDSHHNRFFRDQLKISGLCLRAHGLEFVHPWSGEVLNLTAPTTDLWHKIDELFRPAQTHASGTPESNLV